MYPFTLIGHLKKITVLGDASQGFALEEVCSGSELLLRPICFNSVFAWYFAARKNDEDWDSVCILSVSHFAYLCRSITWYVVQTVFLNMEQKPYLLK